MHPLRQLNPETVLHKIKARPHSARLAPEGDVARYIKHLVILAQPGFLAYYINIEAEVVDETACEIGPAFGKVVAFEAVTVCISRIDND